MPFQTSSEDSRPSPGSEAGSRPSTGGPADPSEEAFRRLFGAPENVTRVLRQAVPQDYDDWVDLGQAARVPGTFIDEDLREEYCDLVFATTMGNRDAYVYLMVERRSVSDEHLSEYRLLGFIARVCDWHLDENPGHARLPAVIPLIATRDDDHLRQPLMRQAYRDLIDPRPGDPDSVTRAMMARISVGELGQALGDNEQTAIVAAMRVCGKAAARFPDPVDARRKSLAWMLESRHGPLTEDMSQRMSEASGAQIDEWWNRLWDATTLDEVFA